MTRLSQYTIAYDKNRVNHETRTRKNPHQNSTLNKCKSRADPHMG